MAGVYTPDFLKGVFEESEDEDDNDDNNYKEDENGKDNRQWCISHLLKSKRKKVVILKQIKDYTVI